MAAADVTLQHASVNSNTAVKLHATKVAYAWKNLAKADPVEGKYDIKGSDFIGFENPKIVINGSWDSEDIGANYLTQTLLINFATLQSTTAITLKVPTGSTPQYLKGRPTAKYETDGDQTLLDTFKIQIESFNITIDNTSQEGRFWSYTIICRETA